MIVERIFAQHHISQKSCEVAVVVSEILCLRCLKSQNPTIQNLQTFLVSNPLFRISSFTISMMQNLQIYMHKLSYIDSLLLVIMMKLQRHFLVERLVISSQ